MASPIYQEVSDATDALRSAPEAHGQVSTTTSSRKRPVFSVVVHADFGHTRLQGRRRFGKPRSPESILGSQRVSRVEVEVASENGKSARRKGESGLADSHLPGLVVTTSSI